MKMSRTLLMATAIIALAACSKKPPAELPPAPGGTDTSMPSGPMTPTGPVKGSQEDFVASVASDRILFALNEYDIDAQDQATLQSQAAWLQQNPAVRVTIEGHADERGTREYNLALGARRASAVRNYLVSRGVSADQLQIISFGKERPLEVCSQETCYSKNRRAVTVISSGLTG